MSDEMKLPELGTEGSWAYEYIYKGKAFNLNVTEELIAQEVLDQTEVKKPARKAILRATEKRIAKSVKSDIESMSAAAKNDFEWNLFILAVDARMTNRHLDVRNDPELAKAIAKEFL